MADQKQPLLQLKPVTLSTQKNMLGPKNLPSVPQILGTMFMGISIIMGIRYTYPIADEILGLWENTTNLKIAAILVMWLVYIFLMWMITINTFWKKQEEPT